MSKKTLEERVSWILSMLDVYAEECRKAGYWPTQRQYMKAKRGRGETISSERALIEVRDIRIKDLSSMLAMLIGNQFMWNDVTEDISKFVPIFRDEDLFNPDELAQFKTESEIARQFYSSGAEQ